MGEQLLSLQWNNYQANLTAAFSQLLQDEVFVDVTLVCEGIQMRAHKVVLSACSPLFQRLFQDNPCQHPVLILPQDVPLANLRLVVDFMYQGQVDVPQDQLVSLRQTAGHLQVKGLMDVPDSSDDSSSSGPMSNSSFSTHKKRANESVRRPVGRGRPPLFHHNMRSRGRYVHQTPSHHYDTRRISLNFHNADTKRLRTGVGDHSQQPEVKEEGSVIHMESGIKMEHGMEERIHIHVPMNEDVSKHNGEAEIHTQMNQMSSITSNGEKIDHQQQVSEMDIEEAPPGAEMVITPEVLGLMPSTSSGITDQTRETVSHPGRGPGNKTWSPEDMDTALEALRNHEMSLSKASATYGIPPTTLWQRAHRMGIDTPKKDGPTKTWNEEVLNIALDALRSGSISVNKAAKEFGIPSSTLYKIAKKEGIKLATPFSATPTSWSQEDLSRALEAVRGGIPVQKASTEYGIPSATLYGRCKREGIELSKNNPVPWSEDVMNEALESVRVGEMSINQAAIHYNLPYSSLYGRFKRGRVEEVIDYNDFPAEYYQWEVEEKKGK